MTISAAAAAPASPAPFDPYALPPEAIEEPPRKLSKALRQIGPGLILAGAIVGTGELIATTNLGAQVGFALLWLVVFSCFIKVFVQVELGRSALSSGSTSIASFAALPGPGPLFVWWLVGMTLVTQFQLGAMLGGVGQAFHLMLPGVSPWLAAHLPLGPAIAARPELPWAFLTMLGTSLLLAVGSYRLVERGTTMMVVMFTLVTVTCVILLPFAGHPIRWDEVMAGLRVRLPSEPGAMMAAFAMFGITGVGASELVAYPYWCIEKGYARKTGRRDGSPAWAARAAGWMSVMRLDAWVSMAVYTTATLAFYFLGASVLHSGNGQGLPTAIGPMLRSLSGMYVPVMGPQWAVAFIVIGAFAVLYSTLFAATAANSRLITDALVVSNAVRVTGQRQRMAWIRLFCIACPLIDFVLLVVFGNPVAMVIAGGFAQALTLPMIATAAIFLRYRRTDPRLAPGRVWDGLLWLSMFALYGAAAYGLLDAWKKL